MNFPGAVKMYFWVSLKKYNEIFLFANANDIYRAIIIPFVVLFGVFGNVVIIVVLSRQFVGRFEVYCFTLAVVQSVALIFNSFLDDFLGRGLDFLSSGRINIKIDQSVNFMCKLLEFIPRVMYFASAYVMVVMAVDRYFVINKGAQFPAPNLHVFRAKFICIFIVTIGAILSSPLLWYYNINNITYENRHFANTSCKLTETVFSEILMYFQSLIVFVLPIFIVIICNIFIVNKLLKRRTLRKRLSSSSSIKKDPNSGSMKLIGYLAISSGFLLISMPLAINIIVRNVKTGPFKATKSDVGVTLSEASKFTSSIKDMHYAINFYLNITFLERFRKDVKKLFSFNRRQIENENSTKRHLTKSYS